jgi:hypothetical protein
MPSSGSLPPTIGIAGEDVDDGVDRRAADPGLDAEPAAGDQPAQQAGSLAPRTPNEARSSTGNGMPCLAPAWPISSIGTSTITLPRRIVPTACFHDMPSLTRPAASM